ncbi:hypothetical protein DIPPA_34502 [Diplonema papillatum]|nr:hypothetical protein DIPPA_34502 [Diplonema papillatum]
MRLAGFSGDDALCRELSDRARARQRELARLCARSPPKGVKRPPRALPTLVAPPKRRDPRKQPFPPRSRQAEAAGPQAPDAPRAAIVTKEAVVLQWLIEGSTNADAGSSSRMQDILQERRPSSPSDSEKEDQREQLRLWTEAGKNVRARHDKDDEPAAQQAAGSAGDLPNPSKLGRRWKVLLNVAVFDQPCAGDDPVAELEYKDQIVEIESNAAWIRCDLGWVRKYNPKLRFVVYLEEVPTLRPVAVSKLMLSSLRTITKRVDAAMELHNDASLLCTDRSDSTTNFVRGCQSAFSSRDALQLSELAGAYKASGALAPSEEPSAGSDGGEPPSLAAADPPDNDFQPAPALPNAWEAPGTDPVPIIGPVPGIKTVVVTSCGKRWSIFD